ncbi:glutamate racemase [Chloroherpeton thalassium ATCC 35110]|uniref:Glutamate racemase n=1 Tax=Chloroherpeton thalassium (strain ATCC 35110 / GB-78) TaxID=517418 RepID=B3QUI7_CHLT3|nr:glutamate racemase [Chloroherpeton thalassium]ACF12893.1 glutamate racemase [Chloroherpeton thalassium ATCC 35110]
MNLQTSAETLNLKAERPIGIFDSGIGGLTVVRKIRERLPNERLIYFGDTARVPYGTKSQVTVRRYAAEDTRLLLKYQPKMIVVACNTVSALALDVVEHESGGLPVLGVLKAGANLAVKYSQTKHIGVIGTIATISSNAYPLEISKLDCEAEVYSKACPLFVPLAEEGFISHQATKLIATEYLTELLVKKIDSLVLGCTHYPILKSMLAEVTGKNVVIIDSAEAVAMEVENLLREKSLLNREINQALPKVLVSDLPQKFKTMFELFLGLSLPDVELVEM